MNGEWNDLADLRSKLCDLLWARHGDDVRFLDLSLIGDTFVLRGEVGSEQAKSDAKRLILGFEDVFKVRNELEVAGYFVAASDTTGDDYFGLRGASDEGYGNSPSAGGPREAGSADRAEDPNLEIVSRYPMVEADGRLAAGDQVKLTIDLVKDADQGQPPIVIGQFPVGWTRIEVGVQFFASWVSEIDTVSSKIVLTETGSTAAVFVLTVAKEYVLGSPAAIQISFLDGTRVCGHVSRDLAPPAIVQGDGSAEGTSAESSPSVIMGSADIAERKGAVRIQPGAIGPTLAVTIMTECDGRQTWMWTARLAQTQLSEGAMISHKTEEAKFAAELLASCPDLSDEDFGRVMAGIGERVWRATPDGFRATYLKCRAEAGAGFPIQLITADPWVPWEMMKPDLEDSDADHLFFDHPICRWPLNVAGGLRYEMVSADTLSFVPTYEGEKDLPSARAEGEWLAKTLGAKRMSADRASFLGVLDGKHPARVGIIHFAGHGRADSGVKDGGIKLQDGWVGVNEVDQSRVKLGRRDGPLVVLNACESGSGGKFLGMNTGWGTTIANRGFGGLIAPLWEVHDEVAFDLMKLALEPLATGRRTLGEAVTAARKAHSERSISSFAYLAHGDVMARFVS